MIFCKVVVGFMLKDVRGLLGNWIYLVVNVVVNCVVYLFKVGLSDYNWCFMVSGKLLG